MPGPGSAWRCSRAPEIDDTPGRDLEAQLGEASLEVAHKEARPQARGVGAHSNELLGVGRVDHPVVWNVAVDELGVGDAVARGDTDDGWRPVLLGQEDDVLLEHVEILERRGA